MPHVLCDIMMYTSLYSDFLIRSCQKKCVRKADDIVSGKR